MTIDLSVPQNEAVELKPRITVVGVGGAGGNAVNNMINANLAGVEFAVANTDAQSLTYSKTDRRIQLGNHLTQGLGAGSKPEIGRAAAEESIDEINEQLKGSHMVFIAAGMGGGTGTGAAPVIARAARDMGVLTVGVVTKPFQFEGQHRLRIADKGIEELEQYVDTLIIIPNQNLFRIANEKTTFSDAFKMADDVLYSGVRGVTDLMVEPGLINLDFADVRSVMSEMGKAMMGTGEAEGERRALDAAEAAISNPLLDDTSMAGAKGVLINITGGPDMTLFEVDEAANRIRAEVDQDAYIIFGSTFEEGLEGRIRVSVVATGIDAESMRQNQPRILNVTEEPISQIETPSGEDEAQIEDMPAVAMSEDEVAAEAAALELIEDSSPDPVAQPESADGEYVAVEQDAAEIEEAAEIEDMVAYSETPAPQAAPSVPSAPAAMTSEAATDSFIPPAPAARTEQVEVHDADPFAAAAMANGAGEASDAKPKRAKGPSLFERVTGSAKNTITSFSTAPKPVAQPEPRSESVQMKASEPTLGGLDPDDRVTNAHAEEDLLDIPAFLRRQAN